MHGDGRVSISRHRKGGHTFKSRRTKLEMERESNKPKPQKPKPDMKPTVSDLFK